MSLVANLTAGGGLRCPRVANCLFKVHLALQFVIKTYFGIENAMAFRLAKGVSRIGSFNRWLRAHMPRQRRAPPLSLSRVSGRSPRRLRRYWALAFSDYSVSGPIKPMRGFDEDLPNFPELADARDDGGARGDASPDETAVDPESTDGRIPTFHEDGEERDFDSVVMDWWQSELTGGHI